jgi:hypothetical protein
MNLYPVTIIENFYENPDAIRAFALEQKYSYCHEIPDVKYVFPGCRSKDLFDLDKTLHEKICSKLISIFHNTEHDYMRWAISTNFQIVTEEYKDGVIHTDHNKIFAAVLYLTPDAPLNSGTSLFKPNKNFDEKIEHKFIIFVESRVVSKLLNIHFKSGAITERGLSLSRCFISLIFFRHFKEKS